MAMETLKGFIVGNCLCYNNNIAYKLFIANCQFVCLLVLQLVFLAIDIIVSYRKFKLNVLHN